MDQSSHDMFGTDVEPLNDERQVGRDSLFLAAEMHVPGYPNPFQVRVRNLSTGGLMAEFAAPVDAGTGVMLDLRGVGRITGTIAWMAEGRIGVAFDRPIDPKLARKPVGTKPAPKVSRPL